MSALPLRLTLLLTISLTASLTNAAIFPSSTGDWPKHWGEEFEPLRKSSTTLGVGTGIQENIYTIPFESREQFEKLWPLLLKQTTPGSKIRLLSPTDGEHPSWGKFLKSSQAAAHVFGPSEGWSVNPTVEREELEKNHEELIEKGWMIKAGAPWPMYLIDKDGTIPEYVVSKTGNDGKQKWVPGTVSDESRGFYNRARVDIELVVDGKIIDLNRIRFPMHVVIEDMRTGK